jgi:hypothetical protein
VRKKERLLSRPGRRVERVAVRTKKQRWGELLKIMKVGKMKLGIICLAFWTNVAIMVVIKMQLKAMKYARLKYLQATLGFDYF